jgi:DNA-binding FadR family transcriptional regulator
MHLLRSQPGTLDHMKEVRLFLECGTARMAAERATEEQIAHLRLTLAQQRAAMSNFEEFVRLDMEFHHEVASISGNPIFPAIAEALFHWISEYYQSLVRAPGAEELTLAEHEHIVNAIAAHDPGAAADAMSLHLNRANALYQQLTRAA